MIFITETSWKRLGLGIEFDLENQYIGIYMGPFGLIYLWAEE